MPQMGESIAEGTLSKWLKKVGDEVKRDEPIFEISTDKVDAEIPAPAAGVLAEILVKEGETVKGAAIEKSAQPAAGGGDVSSLPKAEIMPEAKSVPAAPQREPTPAATPVRQQP